MKVLHDDSKVIDSLGGDTVLGDMLGVSPQCVHNWRLRGIAKNVLLKNKWLLKKREQFLKQLSAERLN